MARKEIGIPLDRKNLNKHNENYKELYDEIGNVIEKVSDEAFDKVVDSARLDWSKMVDKKSDLPSDAEKGTTIGVKEEGVVYRFNGSDWDGIYEINLNPISEVDERLTSQLADKADEKSTSNSLNALKNKKIDKVKFDVSSNKIKFYANDDEVGSIDITESTNSGIIQDYIDDLVSDGLIEGVNISNDSIGENQLKDKSVTSKKMHENANIKFPYYSDDTFDLDYFWDDKTTIASGDVKNNPFGTGCQVINFRSKAKENNPNVWITQVAVVYGSGARYDYGDDAVFRHFRVNESTNEVSILFDWKPFGVSKITSDMLDNNIFIKDYLSDETYDLDDIVEDGNYYVNADVKNNPYQMGCSMNVSRYKTSLDNRFVRIVQFITVQATSRNKKYHGRFAVRVFRHNEDTGEIDFLSSWSDGLDEPLKILSISNSFGLNTTNYIHEIAKSADVNIMTGNLYISGGLLKDHYDNMNENNKAYRYDLLSHIDGQTKDEQTDNVSIDEALAMEDWDYVYLNQASAQSGVYDTFQPYLNDIIDYVKDNLADIKIALMPTWSYYSEFDDSRFDKYDNDQLTMYKGIVSAYKESLSDVDFDLIIPVGTAIQNARTDEYMMDIDNELTRDGYHLGDTGMYIAGLTFLKTFFKNKNIEWKPSPVSKRAAYFANIAANNAVLNPFKVTEL